MKIGDNLISEDSPTYFIADIAANHNGELSKAKELIQLCAESGASAAKFQHFKANKIVSDHGFKSLGNQQSHQKDWKKSVYQIYDDASLPRSWNEELKNTCKEAGIDFFSSPYDIDAVKELNNLGVPAHKIGSGDITNLELVEEIAKSNVPILLASGASCFEEVELAVELILRFQTDLCLMQCNTNYTASLENFKHIHLNVLKSYKERWPDLILGLSDHTPGHSTVLGAVALGARAIEKHFTDSNSNEGPDHKFSLNPETWKEMVDRTRELELALGSSRKFVAENEKETVVLQRRAIRLKKDLNAGEQINREDIECLRPCPIDAIPPSKIDNVLGKKLKGNKKMGEHLSEEDLKE